MIISTYYIETTPNGFYPCWWAVTGGIDHAIQICKQMSLEAKEDYRYPGWFCVVTHDHKTVARYFHGNIAS